MTSKPPPDRPTRTDPVRDFAEALTRLPDPADAEWGRRILESLRAAEAAARRQRATRKRRR